MTCASLLGGQQRQRLEAVVVPQLPGGVFGVGSDHRVGVENLGQALLGVVGGPAGVAGGGEGGPGGPEAVP